MADKSLNGLEKAALLLHCLTPSVVEKVLGHMPAQKSTRVKAEIVKVAARSDVAEQTSIVLDEAAAVLAEAKAKANAAKAQAQPAPSVDIRVGDTPEKKAASAQLTDDADPIQKLASVQP